MRIADMADSHLRNAIALLERNGWSPNPNANMHPAEYMASEPTADMAQMEWSQGFNEAMEAKPPYYSHNLQMLYEELRWRETGFDVWLDTPSPEDARRSKG